MHYLFQIFVPVIKFTLVLHIFVDILKFKSYFYISILEFTIFFPNILLSNLHHCTKICISSLRFTSVYSKLLQYSPISIKILKFPFSNLITTLKFTLIFSNLHYYSQIYMTMLKFKLLV